MRCDAIKLDGTLCAAAAMENDSKCIFHSDEAREKRREAQARGGATTSAKIKKLIPTHLGKDMPDLKLDNAGDAKVALQKVVNWTLKGEIATPVSTAVVNALGVFARLLEATEVEKKIRELEERLKAAA